MTLDSTNVRVAVTGAISMCPLGTTGPTNADSSLGTAFNDLGYAGEDGVTETRDRSTETIQGWQRGDIVREVVTEASVTYTFILIETKKETVELYYGSTVDGTDGSIVIIPANTGGRHGFVIDVIDGDDFIRAWVPQGEVVEVGDQVYANGEAIGYEVTIRCYHDNTIGGSVKKWYSSLVLAA